MMTKKRPNNSIRLFALVVRNPDDMDSNTFLFTRPL